ncbi:hypothetical protein MF672_031750 [Actinomadura sp. ATCC 31491]|uniref:Uncharacterized protein n=1 Tax=Actinomadura luzonensis TaxID=2805427 RepID=A0ABT0G178_9ACTN|nr:hypothetical protein [Actinomadura luzonensis]MCK2218333.1 hypothetical protein [Actinomadura luzonensis]
MTAQNLHHMDAATGLARTRDLLRPGTAHRAVKGNWKHSSPHLLMRYSVVWRKPAG